VESVLNSIDVINEPIDGSVMSGPPFVNRLHSQLLADREPGTTPAMPVYGDGRTVRFLTEQGFADSPGPWGPTRLVYIQHGSDPIVFFAPSLLWSEPDWLEDGQRPPDVSARMDWFPLVTFWQVAADLPGAAGVPKGFGHEYSWRTNTQAWVAVANPPGWTPAKTDKLVALLESQSHFSE